MEHVTVEDVGSDAPDSGVVRRGLSNPLGTTDVAINHYRIGPGEGFPGGLHAHRDQEEVFLVLRGEATFETLAAPAADGPAEAGEVTVSAGEAIRFAPGEFQSGRNAADGDLVALAIGAPRDSEDVRLPVACPACSHGAVRLETAGGEVAFVCPDCGARHAPRACPACGHDGLRVALGDESLTVTVCRACGAEFEQPPLRD